MPIGVARSSNNESGWHGSFFVQADAQGKRLQLLSWLGCHQVVSGMLTTWHADVSKWIRGNQSVKTRQRSDEKRTNAWLAKKKKGTDEGNNPVSLTLAVPDSRAHSKPHGSQGSELSTRNIFDANGHAQRHFDQFVAIGSPGPTSDSAHYVLRPTR